MVSHNDTISIQYQYVPVIYNTIYQLPIKYIMLEVLIRRRGLNERKYIMKGLSPKRSVADPA
jgi:hypothetical protein